MKKFLAIYYGSPASMDKWANLSEAAKQDKQKEGIKVWSSWVDKNSKLIKDVDNRLGKTKKVDGSGIHDTKNQLTAYWDCSPFT